MKTAATIFFLTTSILYSQWQPDVRLTSDTNYSMTTQNNSWCIAASGDTVHVVWVDSYYNNFNYSAVYYKRSTDGGITWEPSMLFAGGPGNPYNPGIVVSGSSVHVIWVEDPGPLHIEDIYYRRSTDGGNSWLEEIPIIQNGQSMAPSLAASGGVVVITWREDLEQQGESEIYARNSTSGGNSWGAVMRLTNAPYGSIDPCAAICGQIVNVVWSDERDANGPESEIYLKRSTTGGNSWGADIRLTNAPSLSVNPCMVASGNTLHLVWDDRRSGLQNHDGYYKRSTDAGLTWTNDARIIGTGGIGFPSLAVEGSIVHVVWEDSPFYNIDVYHQFSTNGGISWQAPTRLTFDTVAQRYPSVAVSNSVVHTVWMDSRHMTNNYNTEIYYKRNPSSGTVFYTCAGTVKYKDNNQPVTSGFAKALKYNYQAASITTVDSVAILSDGTYSFNTLPRGDTLYIMYYQSGDNLDFVPGYYVSTTDWRQAAKIVPLQNLNNTNGLVDRISNSANPYTISGQVLQTGTLDLPTVPLKDAVIYVQSGSTYKNYGISSSSGNYTATKLAPGNYTLTACRLGYAPVTQNVTITNSNVQNINFNFGNPIGINILSVEIPESFSLSQNYPNPFNPSTSIHFSIPSVGNGRDRSPVRLIIYDMLGREVETLVNESLKAGSYSANWNASQYSSGVYFYKLTAADFTETRKMILIK